MLPLQSAAMFVVTLVATLAAANAWVPPARPQCNTMNVMGGSQLLPHEKYCNMFYTCDLLGNQTALYCPDEMLFAYGPGHATCVIIGYANSTCPNWPCDSVADIGRRYPSPCCDEYWECHKIRRFERRVCGFGESYDVTTDSCVVGGTCNTADQDKYCPKKFVAGTSNYCPHSAAADPCMYMTEGWDKERHCPSGASFNAVTCGCTDHNEGCAQSGLSIDEMLVHKAVQPNSQCAATGRMVWNVNSVESPVTVRSDRLGKDVDHYFRRPVIGFSISANGQEAVFSKSSTSSVDNFIYDYFYNDNVMYAPTAFRMTVRFNNPRQNIPVNQQVVLLENRYDPSQANAHCDPSLRITAQYLGVQLGVLEYTISVSMRGESGAQSSMQASISGVENDYFRISVYFGSKSNVPGNVQSGSVENRGSTGQLTGAQAQFQADNRNLGAALARVKCGFAFCRNFNGALRQFAVYEGCSNFANIQ